MDCLEALERPKFQSCLQVAQVKCSASFSESACYFNVSLYALEQYLETTRQYAAGDLGLLELNRVALDLCQDTIDPENDLAARNWQYSKCLFVERTQAIIEDNFHNNY